MNDVMSVVSLAILLSHDPILAHPCQPKAIGHHLEVGTYALI